MHNLGPLTGWQLLVTLLVGFSMLYAAIIAPLIVHTSIRPEIEKRLGKKLEFTTFYNSLPYTYMIQLTEIPLCIGIEYFLSLFGKSTKNIRFFKNYALIKINFDLKDFSRSDIFFSVLHVLSFIIFFGLGAVLCFMGV